MERKVALLACAVATACDPSLPAPRADADPPALRVELTPSADPSGIDPVTHMRIVGAADVAGVALVAGEVGPRQLDQIADGDPSAALAERIVPATVWVEGADVLVAPHVPLEAGARFDLVVALRETIFPLTVRIGAEAPLARLWPPAGGASPTADVFFCGPSPLESIELASALLPSGPRGIFATGSPRGAGARCLRFSPDESAEGSWLPPPVIGETLAVAPGPIVVGSAVSAEAVACEAQEVAFGPGCALVEDDRLTLRPPSAPVLWVVAAGSLDEAVVTSDGAATVLRGLTPSSAISISVETLDAAGWSQHDVTVETLPPRARFVLNEVYANPVGPEPDQEWIEIVNDGTASGDIGSCTFEDIGGETALPSAWLGPGALAVVVNDTFDVRAEYDPLPAPSASVLRVPKLGKNGLSNSGEPLKLTCDDGTVISRFPPLPKPKQGMSVARVTPDAPDGAEASFVLAEAPTPGAPN